MNKGNAVLLSGCMLLAAGSAFAQDAMSNDAMAKGVVTKDTMAKYTGQPSLARHPLHSCAGTNDGDAPASFGALNR